MSLASHFRWYEVITARPGKYARHPVGSDVGLAGELGHDGQPTIAARVEASRWSSREGTG